MGLKSFLKQQGFIEDGPDNKESSKKAEQPAVTVPPTYFPVSATTTEASAPSYVVAGNTEPLATATRPRGSQNEPLDPTFIKFFEDELLKANLAGPDYFEFRQQLIKTQQKMASKGVAAPEVILQAVLTSFEAQDVSAAKLIETANRYKDVLRQKNDDFLKGAVAEKNNQLKKRQDALQAHNDSIQKLQQQLQQLELQKKQLEDAVNKARTQQEVDKTLGKEGIEKIEKAERLISATHDYMQSAIDTDIKRLQSI